MALIVNPSSVVDWNLTRERIADKALEKCNRKGADEPATGEDRALAIEGLESVLKNLLWRGYSFPKTVSGSTTLNFTTGLASLSLPQDFYNLVALKYVDTSGNEVGFTFNQVTEQQWDDIVVKTQQAQFPDRFKIDNFNVLWLWPVPNAALVVKLYYQKVINDSVASNFTDLDSTWMLGIVYGVCSEIADEFNVPLQKIQRFEAKWERQLQLGIMNETSYGPDRMTVSD